MRTDCRCSSVVLSLFSAALIGCSDAGTTAPPDQPPGDDARAALQHLVDSAIVPLGIPGAVVAANITGGAQYVVSSGVDNRQAQSAMNSSDRFRVGSITKSMVATVVLQLVDEHALSLDDVLSKWLPGAVPNATQITVRELLNHTSGVANFTDSPAFVSTIESDPTRAWTPAEEIGLANQMSPSFAPGASGQWRYSNTNYILLGQIIEQVTGKTLANVLQERIFGPLHLSNTSYATTAATPAPFSRGYLDDGTGTLVDVGGAVSPTAAGAGGALVSNAADLLVWAEALASGSLISSTLQSERLASVPGSSPGYGLGVQFSGTWVGHSGEFFGYEAIMYARPGVGSIVVLANRSSGDALVSARLFDAVRAAEFAGQ